MYMCPNGAVTITDPFDLGHVTADSLVPDMCVIGVFIGVDSPSRMDSVEVICSAIK